MSDVRSRNLKTLRTKHSLNQEDVAKTINISEQSYRSKENGHKDFKLQEARDISLMYSGLEKHFVSIEDIFFGNLVYIGETTT